MADTIAQMFLERVATYPELPAQYAKGPDGEFRPTSYSGLLEDIKVFAAALLELGLERGDHVGLVADNSREWLIADLAILGLGAADVPRGDDATEQEIAYILEFSECRLALLDDERQLAKILARSSLPSLRTVILIAAPSPEARAAAGAAGLSILGFAEACELGRPRAAARAREYLDAVALGARADLATIIFTSGTTGEPKGVLLSHGNFLHQTDFIPSILHVMPGHVFLSVLPVWHSFERVVQYIILTCGAAIAYSKPVGSVMLADMQAIRPQWLTSVPRIWESVMDGVYRTLKHQSPVKKALFSFFVGIGESYAYLRDHLLGRVPQFAPAARLLEVLWSGFLIIFIAPLRGLGGLIVFKTVKDKLGGRFIAGISGGGALPSAVDRFFGAIGILILEGYGLTETAPVVGVKPQYAPVVGTVGPPLAGTELKIVDELGERLPPGSKGIIMVRGPSVMLGYYKRPELTAKVLGEDGWLDSGDLGMLTLDGELKITGRAKDTIVLRGGENVEPAPIEQKLAESEYISQAVVVGQDQKYLAALIVPDRDAIVAWAEENAVPIVDYEGLLQQPEVLDLVDYEVKEAREREKWL